MSDGYNSDGQTNITVFESENESEYGFSSNEELDEEDEITKTIITNEIEESPPEAQRPKFIYISKNWKTEDEIKPSLKYVDQYKIRSSKFDIIGCIAKRVQSLSRGAYPLVCVEEDDTEIDIVIKEILENVFPYVIKRDEFLLKFKDFEKISFKYHMDIIKSNLK